MTRLPLRIGLVIICLPLLPPSPQFATSEVIADTVAETTSAASTESDTAAVADPLATLRQEHPRLLFSADDQQLMETLAQTNDLLARLIEQNQINATAQLNEPTIRYEIPDGKRLLNQSRQCIGRVLTMAMAYRLSGEKRYADGAIREMLVAAQFKDWNPSHFLDTAEMTTGLAIGYDWLYAVIPVEDRQTIRQAIVELGLKAGKRVYDAGGWWTTRDNNWNQVCNGGMILGALAIADEEPRLAKEILTAALESIPHGVRVYQPSGAYPEGPSYWQYGTMYTCLTIKALRTALGTDFDLDKTPGFDKTGDFRIHTIGPTGDYFNYADGGTGSRLASAMFLLADVYDRPDFARWHRDRLRQRIPAQRTLRSQRLDRFFPLEIAWFDPRGKDHVETQTPLDAAFQSQQDVVTMRSRWGDADAIYVGFKGGDNQTNHGHLDVGSFVLDALGVRWAIDMGADNYNLPGFFGSRRWQYYRLINHSHNTLVIDGQIQNPQATCPVTSFFSTPNRCRAIVDATDAYKGQANRAWRGIELLGNRSAVHVRDELEGVRGDVRWGIVTRADARLDENRAVLTQDGKTLLAEILSPPGARFQMLPNKPPTAEEKQNEGTRILAFRVQASDTKHVALSVLLQPLEEGQSSMSLSPEPLTEW